MTRYPAPAATATIDDGKRAVEVRASGEKATVAVSAGDGGNHRLVVLYGFGVRLYESEGGTLGEIRDGTFPLPAPPNPPRRSRSAPVTPGLTFAGRHRALLQTAIRALKNRDRLSPAPLVVVGSRRDLRSFSQLAGQLEYSSIRRRRPGTIDSLERFVERTLSAQRAKPSRRRGTRPARSASPRATVRATTGH
jgi:hypothetical protein